MVPEKLNLTKQIISERMCNQKLKKWEPEKESQRKTPFTKFFKFFLRLMCTLLCHSGYNSEFIQSNCVMEKFTVELFVISVIFLNGLLYRIPLSEHCPEQYMASELTTSLEEIVEALNGQGWYLL